MNTNDAGPNVTPIPWTRRILELIAVLAIVVLADVSLYRGQGFTGIAFFLVGAVFLFAFGKARRHLNPATLIITIMLLALAARLIWHGSIAQAVIGFALLLTFTTTLDGQPPYFFSILTMALQSLLAGSANLADSPLIPRAWKTDSCLKAARNLGLPALALLLFSSLFILANPDAVTFALRQWDILCARFADLFFHFVAGPMEPAFWLLVAILAAGLLRPLVRLPDLSPLFARSMTSPPAAAPMYTAHRNTLVAVIALFSAYLLYEFLTLWTRAFPKGFYYAGYAHEGAAWLTVALGLSTVILSLIFTGRTLDDPRLPTLKRLAWGWSLLNLLLSVAVYNRLFIYIDYNGMTRMRIVGLFGITLVVVGFLLVIHKITKDKSFSWLFRRQSWALASAIYLFAILPIDALAVAHNLRRIRQGNLPAVMQIGVQPLELDGLLATLPLLNSPVPEIRDGVAALCVQRHVELEEEIQTQGRHWTAYQSFDRIALFRLRQVRDKWQQFEDPNQRQTAIRRFHQFAYQWY